MSSTTASKSPKREQSHSGFLLHAGLRWAKVAVLLCIASLIAYIWHEPADGPNGGTWLGYTLGGLGAFLILWLTWLGVRKRKYSGGTATVKAWTSAHVYLGLSLIVIATLHCGFQYGWNIHTLAYVLMMLVIASGIYGIVVYTRLPDAVTRLRDGNTREAWIDEVFELNLQSVKLADKIGPEVHRRIVSSVEKVRIGGGLLAQLYGKPQSGGVLEDLNQALKDRVREIKAQTPSFNPSSTAQSTVVFMAGQMTALDKSEAEAARLQQLLDMVARRNSLVARINKDIALHARLQVWLLVHVPLTFALLAALIAHVFSVFFYW